MSEFMTCSGVFVCKQLRSCRTEVMLAEFKRDSARKELETVLQHVHQKRGELRRIEEEIEEQEDDSSDDEARVKVNQEEVSLDHVMAACFEACMLSCVLSCSCRSCSRSASSCRSG